MKILFKFCFLFVGTMCCASAFADEHLRNPSTNLGPSIHGGFTTTITDQSAASFAAEAGPKNYRIRATAALQACHVHQLKLTVEYLWQTLNYRFNEIGNIHRGQNQGAAGLDYRVNVPCAYWRPQVTLNAYYANAAGDTLGRRIELQKHISASNSQGFSPGITLRPCLGTRIGAELNYDNVRYERKYSHLERATGMGGTLYADQQLASRVWIGASAALRKPFNNYQADIAWNSHPYTPAWTFRLVGMYTKGKQGLPTTYNIMLAADYFLDMICNPYRRGEHADEELLNWAAKPAVYMPEVLGLVSEKQHHHLH